MWDDAIWSLAGVILKFVLKGRLADSILGVAFSINYELERDLKTKPSALFSQHVLIFKLQNTLMATGEAPLIAVANFSTFSGSRNGL